MRILLAAKPMGVGGLERIVVRLARELQSRGPNVWVVSSGGNLVDELQRAGTTHVRAPLEITSPIGVAQAARQIRRLIVEHHIDLVHSFSATASLAINIALRGRGSNGGRLVRSPMGLQNSPRELFVQAAVAVSSAEPRARFLVIGEGELRSELELLARSKGLADRLRFTGVREDVARLISATDVYVKPGVVEGFIGITVLEALALSKPVVAFETEDVKLALTDGETGFIVPNGDVARLAERIVYLLRNPDVGSRLGQAGQQVVLERFDFGVLARRLEEFYQGVLGRPAALT